MSLGSRLVLVLSTLALVLGSLGTSPAGAAEPTATTLELEASPAYAGNRTTLDVALVAASGEPIANAEVSLERRADGAWTPVGTVTTDEQGHASQRLEVARTTAANRVRATYAGDPAHDPAYDGAEATTQLPIKRRHSVVVVRGPGRVEDGSTVPVRVRWRTGSGEPVAGTVKLFRALGGGHWRRVRSLHTDADGLAVINTRPRQDSRWRAVAVRRAWVEGDRSPVHRVDNLPPGTPGPAAEGGAAPAPVSSRRSRTPSPPAPHLVDHADPGRGVAPDDRRLLAPRLPGRPRPACGWSASTTGTTAATRAAASSSRAPPRPDPMGAAIAEMFRRRLPIRAMYRVDRFGWGKRSRGGNDYASMSAGNTSAFNCRDVTGRPGVRSPHSYGRSLDLNTWENPYRSARGTVPNTWWQGHAHPRVAWRSRSHTVVKLMARHGFRWTYGLGDTQHFDYVGGRGRALVPPRSCDRYCD